MLRLRPFSRQSFSALLLVLGAMATLDGCLPSGLFVDAAERGYRFHAAGRLDDAVRSYRSALGRHPGDPVLRYNLGTALLSQGRLAEAEAAFLEAGNGPSPELSSLLYHNLALVQLRRALVEDGAEAGSLASEAWSTGKRALLLSPSFQDTRWNLELALRVAERDPDPRLGRGGGSPSSTNIGSQPTDMTTSPEIRSLMDALRSEEYAALHRLVTRTLAGGAGGERSGFMRGRGPRW